MMASYDGGKAQLIMARRKTVIRTINLAGRSDGELDVLMLRSRNPGMMIGPGATISHFLRCLSRAQNEFCA